MFKNALVYRIAEWDAPAFEAIEDKLATARFAECGASQPESAGWVEPRGKRHGALIESVGGQWMLRLTVERKAVPASVVKSQLEARIAQIEADTGRKPRGKAAKELKEEIVHSLLPRAFPKRSSTPVWIAPEARLMVVGTGSVKAADRIVTQIVEALGGGFKPMLLQTQLAPATAMADWLTTREAPAGFTIDRECELKQPDSEKSTVRYARHTLDIDQVGAHIAEGKLPTQLAMSWGDRISFVLTAGMTIKKIKLLDVALEGQPKAGQEDDGFDADVALITGELGRMLPELVEALGGEQLPGQAAAVPGAAPVVEVATAASNDTPPWEEPAKKQA